VQTVPEAVLPHGTAVLNADDPAVAAMAEACRGAVAYFARDGANPVIESHRASGGRAAFVRDGSVVLAEGPAEQVLVPLSDVPMTRGGSVAFQVANVLAASAASWALGLPLGAVRRGLSTFDPGPARFQVREHQGATVVTDSPRNPSAVRALVDALDRLPPGRRAAVLTAAGDRRDEDIVLLGRLVGDAFDSVTLYESPGWRHGRPDGETASLLRRGVSSGSRAAGVTEAPGEHEAVDLALANLRPGDLLWVLPSTAGETPAGLR
jgi:cyanophycin synthetase